MTARQCVRGASAHAPAGGGGLPPVLAHTSHGRQVQPLRLTRRGERLLEALKLAAFCSAVAGTFLLVCVLATMAAPR